jgi:hypothetical protein
VLRNTNELFFESTFAPQRAPLATRVEVAYYLVMVLRLLLATLCVTLPSSTARGLDTSEAFVLCRNAVLVPMWIDAAGPYPFMLDVGAQRPVVALEVAGFLRLPTAEPGRVETRDPAGLADVGEVVAGRELRCGQMIARMPRLLAMDLRPLAAPLGTRVCGIFSGRETANSLTLDFGELRFWTGDNPAGSFGLPMTFSDAGEPQIEVLLNGTHMQSFAIDTTSPEMISMPEARLREIGADRKSVV